MNMNPECRYCLNYHKAAIIGCGFVGAAIAYSLMQRGLFSELVMIDSNFERAKGEALDISHGIPFAHEMKIYAGSYDDITDSSIIIITAGSNQKDGETRLDLVHNNIEIFKTIIPQITGKNFMGILLIVSNPVDILTYAAIKLSALPKERVIGSGTVLDTARLKYETGKILNIDSRSIHAYIIGEHGDSEIAVWSSANVSGVTIDDICKMRKLDNYKKILDNIAEDVKHSAYNIISKKNATYFGIASSITRICEAVIRNEKSILPVSSITNGEYGISDVALSLPAIIGRKGIECKVPISLNSFETEQLKKSANLLKSIINQVSL